MMIYAGYNCESYESLFLVFLKEVILQFGIFLDTAVHASCILGELMLQPSDDNVHFSVLTLPFAQ